MKILLSKHSTSIIKVFIKETSFIDSGTINLYMIIDRNNSNKVASLSYNKKTMYYEFDLSRVEPKNLSDFDYKIKVVSEDGQEDETKKVRLLKGAPHHISGAVKKIQSDFKLVAKTHNGSIIYMFKRIPGEEKCSECWDNDLLASNNSSCPVCGGKGFMSYYSNPYKSYGSAINFVNEKYGTQDQGKTMENTSVTMSAVADFVLTTDDMIYYEKTGDWYRVKARTVSELQTIPTLQMLIMDLMPSNAPETEIAYKLIYGENK